MKWNEVADGFPPDQVLLVFNNRTNFLALAWYDPEDGEWYSESGILKEAPTHWHEITLPK